MTMMITIIIIMTIITLKGAIRDFANNNNNNSNNNNNNDNNNYTERSNLRFLQSPHSAANYLQNERSSGQVTIMHKSCTRH